MAKFQYSAIGGDGQRVAGVMEGSSRAAVIGRLGEQGLHPVEVDAAGAEGPKGRLLSMGSVVGHKELSLFTRELAWLLKAGMTLNAALEVLAREAASPALAAVLATIRDEIRKGRSLHDALSGSGVFPQYYVSMVDVGEASGTLPAVLERLAASRDRDQKLRSRLTSSLIYPAVLVVLSAVAVLFIMISIVPSIKEMIAGSGAPVPDSAQSVIAVSDWLIANGFTALVIALLAAVLAAALAGGAGVRRMAAVAAFRIPLIGGLLRKAAVVQFCRVLGTLLAAGVGLPASLKLMKPSAGSPEIANALAGMEASLRRGEDFLAPLERSRFFPPLVARMLRVGNETGNLTPSVLQVTGILEDELDTAIDRALTLIGPVIILVLSAVVAFIITSLMGAIISVNDLAL